MEALSPGLTSEAAVCDVEHEARPLCWRLPVALRWLLLCRLSLLFSLYVLCEDSSGIVYPSYLSFQLKAGKDRGD